MQKGDHMSIAYKLVHDFICADDQIKSFINKWQKQHTTIKA